MALGLRPRRIQRRLIDRIRSSDAPTLRHYGTPVVAKSLRELMALDPASIYAQVRVPTLLIGGAKDVQCDPVDVASIATLLGALATPMVMSDLTHVLRRHAGPVDLLMHGRLLSRPVDEELLATACAWIAARGLTPERGASP